MSFLDVVPQRWSDPELPALRDLCVLAFGTVTRARELAEAAEIHPGTFPEGRNARAVWTALLKELGNQGKLRHLVRLAAEDPEASAYREGFLDMLEDRPTVAVPPPERRWRDRTESPDFHLQRLLTSRDRLLDVEVAAQLVAAARSVARLRLRFGELTMHGTAFLIGSDLVLTNHHNLAHPDHGAVTHAVAEFDHDRTPSADPVVRRLDLTTVAGDAALDWAAVRLDQPVSRPPLRLGSPYDVHVDDTLIIIQHPLGYTKKFALESFAVRDVHEALVEYVADTQDGSSGSPVFNQSMHVVALHRAEKSVDVVIAGRPVTVWRNQGVLIEAVMHGLRAARIPFETSIGAAG